MVEARGDKISRCGELFLFSEQIIPRRLRELSAPSSQQLPCRCPAASLALAVIALGKTKALPCTRGTVARDGGAVRFHLPPRDAEQTATPKTGRIIITPHGRADRPCAIFERLRNRPERETDDEFSMFAALLSRFLRRVNLSRPEQPRR